MKRRKIKYTRWFLFPLLAVVFFGLTRLLNHYPVFTERYYSQGLYPLLATVFSFLSRWVPVSLSDIFYLILILLAVAIIILGITRKLSWGRAVLVVINSLALLYIGFYLLWGFNYFRADINSRLGISPQESNQEEFETIFRRIVEETNHSYHSFNDFSKTETDSLVENSFKRMAGALKLKYPSGSRRSKYITLSGFFAQAGISGYYGPFFSEVHINRNLLPVEYAFVLAHEKAHQFGITGEAEANFISWLICTSSDSDMLRYSANIVALRYFINHAAGLKHLPELMEGLDKRVIDDLLQINRHWMALRNEKVEKVAAKVNDAYLKTNQVEKGIRDYTGIVRHIMEFSLDTAFRENLQLHMDTGRQSGNID